MTAPEDALPEQQSALVVLVPEADALVASHRLRLDPSAAWGVPAHVTVLHPLPATLSAGELARLAEAVRTVSRFDCGFSRVRWFDDDVLWLAPDPDEPFRALTRAVCAALPNAAPYDGRIALDDLVPHLTVGDRNRGAALDDLRAAAVEIAPRLPLRAQVRQVALMRGRAIPDDWTVVDRLPLG